MFMEVDAAFTVVFASTSLRSQFGDPDGRTCYRYIGGMEKVCQACPVKEVMQGAQKAEAELVHRYGQGREIALHLTAVPIKNGKGGVVGSGVLMFDVSHRKRLEELVQHLEQRYQRLVDQLPDVIFSLDSAGRFTFLNPQAEEFFGYPLERMLGAYLKNYVAANHMALADSLVTAPPRSVWDREMAVLDSQGKRKWVRIRCKPSLDELGDVIGFEGMIREGTLRKKLEEELKASKKELMDKMQIIEELHDQSLQWERAKAIEEHTAEFAHELKQPLTIIGGFARRMAKKLKFYENLDPDTQPECYYVIMREVRRLENLLSGLVDYTRHEAIQLESVDPTYLIEEVLRINQERLKEKNLRLEVDFADDLGDVSLDPGRFQHVIRNLLANAIEASPKEGTIRVETRLFIPEAKARRTGELESETYFEVKIYNGGSPIPTESLPKIFDPFYSTKDHGAGIGLALTKKIVEEHHGSISAQSGDRRTVFTVRIPMKPVKAATKAVSESKAAPSEAVAEEESPSHLAEKRGQKDLKPYVNCS
jgi:PAS domain S-box-containing protein